MAFANGEKARARAHLDLAAKRAAEAQQASERGRGEAAVAAAEAYRQRIVLARQQLEQAAGSGKDVAALVSRLEENLDQRQAVLEAAYLRAPDQAKDAIEKAGTVRGWGDSWREGGAPALGGRGSPPSRRVYQCRVARGDARPSGTLSEPAHLVNHAGSSRGSGTLHSQVAWPARGSGLAASEGWKTPERVWWGQGAV